MNPFSSLMQESFSSTDRKPLTRSGGAKHGLSSIVMAFAIYYSLPYLISWTYSYLLVNYSTMGLTDATDTDTNQNQNDQNPDSDSISILSLFLTLTLFLSTISVLFSDTRLLWLTFYHTCLSQTECAVAMRNGIIGFAECVRPGGRPTYFHCLEVYNYSGVTTSCVFVPTFLLMNVVLNPITSLIRVMIAKEHQYGEGVEKNKWELYLFFLRYPMAVQGEGPSNGDGLSALNGLESMIYPYDKEWDGDSLDGSDKMIEYLVDQHNSIVRQSFRKRRSSSGGRNKINLADAGSSSRKSSSSGSQSTSTTTSSSNVNENQINHELIWYNHRNKVEEDGMPIEVNRKNNTIYTVQLYNYSEVTDNINHNNMMNLDDKRHTHQDDKRHTHQDDHHDNNDPTRATVANGTTKGPRSNTTTTNTSNYSNTSQVSNISKVSSSVSSRLGSNRSQLAANLNLHRPLPYWQISSEYHPTSQRRVRLRDFFHDKLFCHNFFAHEGIPKPFLLCEIVNEIVTKVHYDINDRNSYSYKKALELINNDRLILKPRYSTMGLGVEKFNPSTDIHHEHNKQPFVDLKGQRLTIIDEPDEVTEGRESRDSTAYHVQQNVLLHSRLPKVGDRILCPGLNKCGIDAPEYQKVESECNVPYLIEEQIVSTELQHLFKDKQSGKIQQPVGEWYRMTTLWSQSESGDTDTLNPRPGYIWRTRNKEDDPRIQTDIIGGCYCVTSKSEYLPWVGPRSSSFLGKTIDPRQKNYSKNIQKNNNHSGNLIQTTALNPQVDIALQKAIAYQLHLHKILGKELWSIGWDVMIVDEKPVFLEFNVNNGFFICDHSLEECYKMAKFYGNELKYRNKQM